MEKFKVYAYFYRILSRYYLIDLVESLSKKEDRKKSREFSDEQIEKMLDYRHDLIQEKIEEIRDLVKAYPTLSIAVVFTLGLVFGIYVSDSSR
ncbi:hypothetical protein KAR91_22415 [Candidatus Pacearchaeota archaeon]|nr:hypothetical protein [Candidatus Pacearchaeota archaeon]